MSDEERERAQNELYLELRRRAARLMRGQPVGHTLQPTALVHEVFLKLSEDVDPAPEDRGRFLALASRAMRHVLVDHARARGSRKRTPEGERVLLDEAVVAYEDRALDLLALDEALEELADGNPNMARAVELRFFGGLSMEEVATALDIPKRTFERQWQVARDWLRTRVS